MSENLGASVAPAYAIAIEPALAALATASPLGVIAIDATSRVRLWNAAAEQLLGWKAGEVLGTPLTMPGALAAQLQCSDSRELLCHWITRSGDPAEVRVSIADWLDSESRRQGVLLTAWRPAQLLSATERVELIENAREAREEAHAALRFRELLEAAPDAIVKVDRTGRIVLMNRATEHLFGYTREELLGQPVEILVPQASRAAHVGMRNGYANHPATRPMGRGLTLRAVRKDGSEFPVEISLSPVHAEHEVRFVAIIRDVTERTQIEEEMRAMEHRFNKELTSKNIELERRNQEIEQADQLKSEFLASMSHELRTPLHTIIGFSELLAEEIQGPLNSKQRRFVEHIHRDSQHLLELINDILDLSKIESGKVSLRPEVFAARTEVQAVVDSVRTSAEAKSIRLETRIDDEFVLLADKVRFREVLFNLLSNAVKFTPSGGQITLGTVSGDEGSDPGFCGFYVEDTGIGIPAGQAEAIFDKFYQVGSTTKGVREGTGLGLTITRHIVELHGGRIRVESEPGHGSKFVFTMPRDPGQ